MHRRSSSVGGETSALKKAQKAAAKAAAARLALVMASQTAEDGSDEEIGGKLTAGTGSRYGAPPLPVRSNGVGHSPSHSGRKYEEHTSSVQVVTGGRSTVSVRSAPLIPPSKTPLKDPYATPAKEPPINKHREKRFSADIRHLNFKEPGNNRETSELQDEIDMLQEENENILEKLRLVEVRCEEAEARARELEKEVASLGESFSLEAQLLSRKEARLRQREAALRAAEQTKDGRDEEIECLQREVEAAKDEVVTAIKQLGQTESEVKALRSMSQRMILTEEEMEEVVVKRCWLARYWGLAVRRGICSEIASSKYEYWSTLAPLPFEIVISAGQEAKKELWNKDGDNSERGKKLLNNFDVTGEGDIESMVAVEKGLRELGSLKVEELITFILSQHGQPGLDHRASDHRLPGDLKFMEAYELSQEESEDVLFKQAWLRYFWRRAKVHRVEEDVADKRLQFWSFCSGQSLTSHDALDVDRGLKELRELGIEQKLWEASRREQHQASPASNL